MPAEERAIRPLTARQLARRQLGDAHGGAASGRQPAEGRSFTPGRRRRPSLGRRPSDPLCDPMHGLFVKWDVKAPSRLVEGDGSLPVTG
jgi:hypothetical protein